MVLLVAAAACGKTKPKGQRWTGDCNALKATVATKAPEHADLTFQMCQEKKLNESTVRCLEEGTSTTKIRWCLDEQIKFLQAGH